MKRIEEVWFEFKGIRNTDMNVRMMAMPVRPHPAERGEQAIIPGRDGFLWIPDGGFDSFVVRVPCLADGDFDIDAINAWLSGAGDLRFSDEPGRVYRARVTKEFSRSNKLARFTAQDFTPSFDVQPFRYLHPPAGDWVRTESGHNLPNPGTVASEPKIIVEGSGDFVLWINTQQIDCKGVTDGIVIDSEMQDCFNLTEDALRNSLVDMDEFPLLRPGANLITWEGPITKVTITPRWRYL